METPLAPSSLFSPKQLLAVASELYLRPLASILLIRSAWVGAGLWILLLQEPRLAVVAFLALSVIEVISQVMARGDGIVFGALTRANALLCSLAMAWLLAPMTLPFLLEIVLVFAALSVGLYFTLIFRRLLTDTTLPPVIWPYTLLAAISVTLFPFGVPDSMVYFGWPVVHVASIVDLPRAFLQSMGVFLFSPWVLSGIGPRGIFRPQRFRRTQPRQFRSARQCRRDRVPPATANSPRPANTAPATRLTRSTSCAARHSSTQRTYS